MTQKTPVYIVSGGAGTSGDHLARTALAQFHEPNTSIVIVPHVKRVEQLEEVVSRAVTSGGIIVHTLVDSNLRHAMEEMSREHNVAAVDLIGMLMSRLTDLLNEKPMEKPGLYRQIRGENLKRSKAIEFTVDHDDGRKPDELPLADIVLAGVSRVGKTPLSMYLAIRGWKIANVPIIPQLTPPEELFQINSKRVIGLLVKPEQLVAFRRRRQQRLGTSARTDYDDLDEITEELDYARRIFRQGGFKVIDITDKPVEESAEEIITYITRYSID